MSARRPGRARGWLALALALGCGDDTRPASDPPPSTLAPSTSSAAPEGATPDEPTTPATPTAPTEAPPLVGLEALDELDLLDESAAAGGAPTVPLSSGAPTELGCTAIAAPMRVLEGAGRPAIARASAGYVVAAYVRRGAGEAVAIARLDDGRPPSLFATLPIEAPVAEGARRAPPALALAEDGRLLVAATSASGALLYADLEMGSTATADALRTIVADAHADARFPPAIAPTSGATAVAWTDGSATPMRVRVARVGRTGALLDAPHDVTPDAGGAAAPSVGRGMSSPTLFVVDPRVSISVVSRAVLAADATPGATEVVRPLARAADPASFVVFGEGAAQRIAYVAVGSSGSRAVGLLRADGSEPPAPVVPGLGFGEPINVDAAALGDAAVLAAEAPSAADPDAPHETRVRVVSADGRLSEPLVLAGATEPAIASAPDGGAVVASTGGYVTRLACRAD